MSADRQILSELRALGDAMNRLEHRFTHLEQKMEKSMSLLDDIQTKADANLVKATANTDALASIKIRFDGFVQQIAALKVALDTAGTDPAKLQVLSDTMDKLVAQEDTQADAEAVLTNTGVDPSGNG